MKTKLLAIFAIVGLLAASLNTLAATPPKMKMTTEIPPEITIADKVERPL